VRISSPRRTGCEGITHGRSGIPWTEKWLSIEIWRRCCKADITTPPWQDCGRHRVLQGGYAVCIAVERVEKQTDNDSPGRLIISTDASPGWGLLEAKGPSSSTAI